MNNSFIPKQIFQKFLRYWFYLPIASVLGGVVGLILHGFIPPIFEAQAKFLITIDYTRTGYLSDIQEDQAMRGVGSLIGSDFILQKTIDHANQVNEVITLAEIKEKSKLERGEFEWYIRIRDENPVRASKLVNLWADQAIQVLDEASLHALKAEVLFNYLDSMELCLQRVTLGVDCIPSCEFKDSNQILGEIKKVGQEAYQEKEASRGLMPALSVDLVQRSAPPTKPVVFAKNTFVLAGAIIGWILMLVLLSILNPNRRLRKK